MTHERECGIIEIVRGVNQNKMNQITPVKRKSFILVIIPTVIFAILVVLFPIPQSVAYAPPALQLFDTKNTNVDSVSIVNITNKERLKNAILPLTVNGNLQRAAENKAEDMILAGYFEHYSPGGISPWQFILNAGYDYSNAGENLAMDFQNSQDIVKAWMQSSSHRRNILNPEFYDIGVAAKRGKLEGHDTYLIVQMFGKKRGSISQKFDGFILKVKSLILGG